MNTANHKQELKKIYRFFKNRVSKYIFLIVDDQRILKYLVIQVQIELKKQEKEILHLKLRDDNFSIYNQLEEFLAGTNCNGLIVSNIDSLIYNRQKETINHLNRSRDAFEKFQIPIIFILNNDNLKKIISGATDFYQLRDMPDFHFEGTMIEDREILDINIPQVESYTDSDLKAELLEEQLKIIDKKKKIDKDALNNIIMPLLNIYMEKGYYNKMQDLFNRFVKGKEDLVKHKMLLGDYYANIYAFDKALSYYEEELKYSQQAKNFSSLSKCYHQIGIIYQSKGDYDSALKQYEKSLEIEEKIGDNKRASYIMSNIGAIYQDKGDYDAALKHYEKSLQILEKIGDIKGISISSHQIGNIYYLTGDYDAALKHFEKSLKISNKIGDIKGTSYSLINIGLIYQEKGDYDAALKNFERSLEILEKIGDIKGVSYSLHNIGAIYQDKGDYDSASKHYEKSLEIKEKIGDISGLAKTFGQMGNLHLEKENYPGALRNFVKAFLIFTKLASPIAYFAKQNILSIKEKISKNQFLEIIKEFNITEDFFAKEDNVINGQ